MNVSMDGLRWQLLRSYNSLTHKLNSKIEKDWGEKEIIIDPDYIQKEMDLMRSCIVTLAFMYDKREGGFNELENPKFESFNEDEEEFEEEF
jgi:hypothetical protein